MKLFLQNMMMPVLFVLFGVQMSMAQGVTSSSMNGRILDTSGESLIGANVVAVHLPSGTVYGNVTDVDGYYRIQNMRVGGPYKVTISYTGYADQVKENIYLRLGQSFNYSTTLRESAVELEGVEVVANRNDIFDGNSTGSKTTIDERQINILPTVSRSLGDFTRLTPSSTTQEGNDGFSLSFNGMNNRYNAIYIDGAVNNDVFGLAGSGTNGGQTGVSPISVDAIEELQVNLAPFDVKIGGFAGAAISAITRSGTNNLEGSVYHFFRNENFAGKTPTDNPNVERVKLDPYTAKTTGFRLGGALKKNKLFFFVNGEIQRDATPLPFDFADYNGNATQDDLSRLVNRLQEFGYDPGTYTNNRQTLDSDKLTAKLDWNINDKHKLSLRHGYVKANNLEGVQSNSRTIAFLNSSESFVSTTNSTALELNSVFNSKISNNLMIGYTRVRDDRDPTGDPFPYVNIDDGSGSIRFGSERFSTANLLNQDVLTFTNNLNIYKGAHTFTFGTHNEFYSIGNLFIPFNYGSYEFDSLDDFLNGENSSFYIRSYSLKDNLEGDETDALASFNAGQLGLYIQDEYQVNNKLKITAGLRMDLPFYGDTPVNESFNTTTIPMLEAAGYDLEGARTGKFIKAVPMLSPRLGFNLDLSDDNSSQLRGGVGVFTSRAPLVWVGGAFNNYGLNRGTILGFGDIPFNPDWQNQPPGDIDLNNISPSGDIDLFANDFRLPKFLKTNLIFDKKLGKDFVLQLDANYIKTLRNVAYKNLNLKPSTANLTGTPDDRPIYDRRDEIDPTYNRIILGTNTSEGHSYNFSAQLSKNFSNGFQGMAAYSWGDAFSIFDGTSSQNSSQWRGLHTIRGRNIDQPLARSNFAQGGRFILGMSKELKWSKAISTTLSIFHESQQGRPYSYIYNDRGRLKNEDSRERELIFVPATSNDIVLVDDGGVSADEQWAALDAFISNDPYLSTRRGQYAERNASFGPWSHVMDLKILQDFNLHIADKKHTFQLSLDIFNFTNLINKDWGRRYFYTSNVELLNFKGFMQDGTTPTFSFDSDILNDAGGIEPFIDDAGIQSSRWQMQLGVRYLFR